MKKDEADVRVVMDGIKTWVPNIWESNQPLINIASGEEETKGNER